MSPVCSYGMGPDCTYSTHIEFFCLEKSRRIKNGKQIIFFWGQYYFFFAIPFRGIDESISGWMTIACIINNFCEVEFANVLWRMVCGVASRPGTLHSAYCSF